ncbi:MAG TPA: phospholipid carrier-dependent glycosyltransferase [Streptosporangiaceae bacterium]|nr:phospholipid carrier-dependent glycosyltransferase [Streptosporangiaceae bacterium]
MVRDLCSRVRAQITHHPSFAAALTMGAALRMLAVLGYPGALWFSDSFIYLGVALRPEPDPARAVGYSLFLRALEPFHSLALVTGLQHLMGLGIAVMIYAVARRSAVPQGWACMATLPVLLDGFEIEDEHMVMAEALFTFLVMLAMLLILRRGRVSWPTALLAGVIAGCAVDVRTEGLPLLIVFAAFLPLRSSKGAPVRNGRHNGRGWVAAGTMVFGCAMPVLAYMGWFHAWTGEYMLTRSDGFYLWGRVSSFAECKVIRPPADELELCPPGSPSGRTPPGDYIWRAPQVRALAGGPFSAANDALLRDFAFRAIKAQPLGYLHSLLSGLAQSVLWPRRPYPNAETVYFYYFHPEPQVIPADRSWVAGGTPFQDAVQYGRTTPSQVVEPFAILISWYEQLFFTYGPLFGLILLTGLGGVVRIRRKPARLAWCRRRGSMLPWITAVVLLVFPIATADFDYRYLLPPLPFACLAAALAFAPMRVPVTHRPAGPGPDHTVTSDRVEPGNVADRLAQRAEYPGHARINPLL